VSLATIEAGGQLAAPATAGPVTLRDELEMWQGAYDLAKVIAPTDFVPKALRNNPPAVMACILKGAELGVSALHALSQVHIIDGRACVAAELQRALILSKGHEVWTEEMTVTRVTLCGQRQGREHVQKITWTTEDAKRAGLLGKQNWRTYPRAMLLARATGELARLMFADVIAGMSYTVEELTDGIEVPEQLTTTQAARPVTHRRSTGRRPVSGKALPPPEAAPEGGPPGPEVARVDPPSLPGDDSPDEPAEVLTGRAQAIAMQARRAGIDHHNVVAAVTHGRTSTAKDLSDSDAAAVIQAIADLAAERIRLEQDDEGAWRLIGDETGEEPAPGPPAENLVDRVAEIRNAQADRKRGGQQTLPTSTPQEDT
jgi:hypothetical protein